MREILEAAARKALGGPIPDSIKVTIDTANKRVIMIGPMCSGKTRIARAVPPEKRVGWTCLTGFDQREIDRRHNDEWPR